jgi:transcription antitermination factor NusA-like protein
MAINWDTLKTRYLQSDRAAQLDSLVLNLTRIQSLVESDDDGQIAKYLVRESQFLIEWLVPTIDLSQEIGLAEELVALQRQLSGWKLDWTGLWANTSERAQMAIVAQGWYNRLRVVV